MSFRFYKKTIKKFSRGFTVLELLFVVLIIAIISTLLFTAFNRARLNAEEARLFHDKDAIIQAIRLYYEDHHAWPPITNPQNLTQSDPAACLVPASETCFGDVPDIKFTAYGDDGASNALIPYMNSIPRPLVHTIPWLWQDKNFPAYNAYVYHIINGVPFEPESTGQGVYLFWYWPEPISPSICHPPSEIISLDANICQEWVGDLEQ